MNQRIKQLDELLRGEATGQSQLEGGRLELPAREMCLMILALGALSGLCTGSFALFRALFVQSNPIPLKFALSRMGRIRNELRLPLVPLSDECKGGVIDALRGVGAL